MPPSDRLPLVAVRVEGRYKVIAAIRREIVSAGTWIATVSLNGEKLTETKEVRVFPRKLKASP